MDRLTWLRRKADELTYVVKSYGDLGTARELEEVRKELAKLTPQKNPTQGSLRLVA
jgi:hypothetical protein